MVAKDNISRRDIMTVVSLAGGAVGVAGVATPFVASFAPSRKAKGEGAPIEVSLANLETGSLYVVEWRRKPVWILRRTDEMLARMTELSQDDQLLDPASDSSKQPEYCKNATRSIKSKVFVALGVCTHLGCSPGDNAPEGFLCACHGSSFDYAGRVFKGSPAPKNLEIPEHHYPDDGRLVVGASSIDA